MDLDKSTLETVVVPGMHDFDDNFEVRRAIPTIQKCMVARLYFWIK